MGDVTLPTHEQKKIQFKKQHLITHTAPCS